MSKLSIRKGTSRHRDPELAAQFSMDTFGARQHTAVFFARP